jgi:hypothetical protein|tara:strand:- start:915 stop:1667 length:753 start_codon:yes stop_codon:yes gene_type:complete
MDAVEAMLASIDDVADREFEAVANLLEQGTILALDLLDKPYELLPVEFERALLAQLTGLWQAAALGSTDLTGEFLLKQLSVKNTAELLANRFLEDYGRQRTSDMAKRTQTLVVEKIRRGMARGQSREELIRQLRNETRSISEARARVIVDNEAHTLSQYASQQLAQQSQKLLLKIWNTAQDNLVRGSNLSGTVSQFNHRVMQGVARPLMAPFLIPMSFGGAEALMFPHDPNGSAGNVISCRCIQTYKEAL